MAGEKLHLARFVVESVAVMLLPGHAASQLLLRSWSMAVPLLGSRDWQDTVQHSLWVGRVKRCRSAGLSPYALKKALFQAATNLSSISPGCPMEWSQHGLPEADSQTTGEAYDYAEAREEPRTSCCC